MKGFVDTPKVFEGSFEFLKEALSWAAAPGLGPRKSAGLELAVEIPRKVRSASGLSRSRRGKWCVRPRPPPPACCLYPDLSV